MNYVIEVLLRERTAAQEALTTAQQRLVEINTALARLAPDAEQRPANPFEHVHVAKPDAELQKIVEEDAPLLDRFDKSGDMPPATAVVTNNTGEPEQVLTAQENAGPAPWEVQADEAPAKPKREKPKRRTNEELAEDAGVKLSDVQDWKGGGRVTKADIEEFAKLHPAAAVADQTLEESVRDTPEVVEDFVKQTEPEETDESEFTEVGDDDVEEDVSAPAAEDDGFKPPF
jgi:hypothetical protein